MKVGIGVVGICALLIGVAGASQAETPDFGMLDADSDGQITVDEMQDAADARFACLDANEDGAVSADELLPLRIGQTDQMIKRFDENEDGVVQLVEAQNNERDRLTRAFAEFDTDESGGLSVEEFDAAHATFGKERNEQVDK